MSGRRAFTVTAAISLLLILSFNGAAECRDLFRISEKSGCGFIDREGNKVIPPTF